MTYKSKNVTSKLRSFLGVLFFTPLALMSIQQNASALDVNFVCGREPRSGIPATIAELPGNESVIAITWEITSNPDWQPQQRCEAVSERLNNANEQGILSYFVEGTMNRQRVVCASPKRPGNSPIRCNENNLLVTMLGNVNPQDFILALNDGLGNRSGNRGRQHGTILTSPDGRMVGLNVAYFLADLLSIPRCSSAPIGTKCRP